MKIYNIIIYERDYDFFNLIKIESFQSEENAKLRLNDLLSKQKYSEELQKNLIEKRRFLYKLHGEDKNNLEKEIEILEENYKNYNKDNFYNYEYCSFCLDLIESNLNE